MNQTQAGQTFVCHTRAKGTFNTLQTTERSFSATRSYWESAQKCNESFDVGVELRDLGQSCSQ